MLERLPRLHPQKNGTWKLSQGNRSTHDGVAEASQHLPSVSRTSVHRSAGRSGPSPRTTGTGRPWRTAAQPPDHLTDWQSRGKGQRGSDAAIAVPLLSDTQDFRERTPPFCEMTHAGSMNSAGSPHGYLRIRSANMLMCFKYQASSMQACPPVWFLTAEMYCREEKH